MEFLNKASVDAELFQKRLEYEHEVNSVNSNFERAESHLRQTRDQQLSLLHTTFQQQQQLIYKNKETIPQFIRTVDSYFSEENQIKSCKVSETKNALHENIQHKTTQNKTTENNDTENKDTQNKGTQNKDSQNKDTETSSRDSGTFITNDYVIPCTVLGEYKVQQARRYNRNICSVVDCGTQTDFIEVDLKNERISRIQICSLIERIEIRVLNCTRKHHIVPDTIPPL